MKQREKYRTKYEIYNAILIYYKEGQHSNITDKIKLNWLQLKDYQTLLFNSNLIEKFNGTFILTEKGRTFIQKFEEIKSLLVN